ncbi:MAG: hypothetical protein HYY86_00250 [Candidatus Harrisonbacteria bacterium]|nr:hypothetical protein [Candidatus Harrisonbacteria bacterium]
MNISESPYQRLIDIIDTILIKNETTKRGGEISLHILEIPSLPQNGLSIKMIEDLLVTLKKKGAIRTFEFQNGGTQHVIPKLDRITEKKLLAERQRLFDLSKIDALETNQPVSLKDERINFDDEEATIHVGKRKCSLPPFKNEHFFCRAMFSYRPNEPVDWSAVYRQMTGGQEDIAEAKYKRTVQDTMYALNNRIKEVINTKDTLFTWENRTIKRNF